LSSAFSLGVQQTEALFFGAQHEDAAGSCFFSTVTLLLVNTGISVCVSIVLNVFTFKDGDIRK
jgi:hypothetical protein